MQRKRFPLAMTLGAMAGALLSGLLRMSIGGEPWNWSTFFGSLTGVAVGALILWRFWTPPPPPSNPQAARRRGIVVMSLMLLALIPLALMVVIPQAVIVLYMAGTLLLVTACVVGFLTLEPAQRDKARWPMVLGLGFLVVMASLAVLARLADD